MNKLIFSSLLVVVLVLGSALYLNAGVLSLGEMGKITAGDEAQQQTACTGTVPCSSLRDGCVTHGDVDMSYMVETHGSTYGSCEQGTTPCLVRVDPDGSRHENCPVCFNAYNFQCGSLTYYNGTTCTGEVVQHMWLWIAACGQRS